MVSKALRPGWLFGHAVVAALFLGCVLLGRWQWGVGRDLRNYGYALQWWVFAVFGLVMWIRLVRESGRAEPQAVPPDAQPEEPVAYRRYVMPTGPTEDPDPVRSAYNDYLAGLAKREDET